MNGASKKGDGASVAVITQADGPHVTSYLTTLAVMDRVQRVHVCDPSGHSFGFAEEALGKKLAGTSGDAATCLKAGSYAFALVALDNTRAAETIAQVLDAGVHVFSEKTGARTAEEWKPIMKQAEEKGLLVGMSYPNRYRPSVREARSIIRSGALGRLYGFYVQTVATQAWMRNPAGNWMFHRATSGGGYLIWLGCHYLDLLRYVAGEEVATVGAIAERVSDVAFDVEDAMGLTLKLERGAVGTANFGYYLDAHPKWGSKQSQMIFWGERGWVRLAPGDDEDAPLEVYSTDPSSKGVPYRSISFGHTMVPKAYGNAWGLAFLDDFLAACLGEGEPPVGVRDADAVLRIIDASYRSASERRIVDLVPPE